MGRQCSRRFAQRVHDGPDGASRCDRSRPGISIRRRRRDRRSRAACSDASRSAGRSRSRASGNRSCIARSCGMSITKITSLAATVSARERRCGMIAEVDAACRGNQHRRRMRRLSRHRGQPGGHHRDPTAGAERLRDQPRRKRASDDVAVTDDQDARRRSKRHRQRARVAAQLSHLPALVRRRWPRAHRRPA